MNKKLFKFGAMSLSAAGIVAPISAMAVGVNPTDPHTHVNVAELPQILQKESLTSEGEVNWYYNKTNENGFFQRPVSNFKGTTVSNQDFGLVSDALATYYGTEPNPHKYEIYQGINEFRLDNQQYGTWLYDFKTNVSHTQSTFYFTNEIAYYVQAATATNQGGIFKPDHEDLRIIMMETFIVVVNHNNKTNADTYSPAKIDNYLVDYSQIHNL